MTLDVFQAFGSHVAPFTSKFIVEAVFGLKMSGDEIFTVTVALSVLYLKNSCLKVIIPKAVVDPCRMVTVGVLKAKPTSLSLVAEILNTTGLSSGSDKDNVNETSESDVPTNYRRIDRNLTHRSRSRPFDPKFQLAGIGHEKPFEEVQIETTAVMVARQLNWIVLLSE